MLVLGVCSSKAQTLSVDYKVVNVIASCKNVQCVVKQRTKARGKIERAVLYSKWLLLNPSNHDASRNLLENIPATEEEAMAIVTLADPHEGVVASGRQVQQLGLIYTKYPELLATSVRRHPKYLPAYLRYGCVDNDIHSKYSLYARKVCLANWDKFMAAFKSLTPDEQQRLRGFVLDPNQCRRIFEPEAQ